MSGPRRLNAILERWNPVPAGHDADPGSGVAAAWPEAVGPDVARRTRPGKLRDGVLTVYTAGSTWSHQLTFLAPTIVAELNARCADAPVRRLRFVVAAGRTKALIDGALQQGLARARQHDHNAQDRAAASGASAVDAEDERAEDIVARLRRRQQSLDRRREREGWTRCTTCGTWRAPAGSDDGACSRCAEDARRAADLRIERVLVDAPWLRRDDVAAHLVDVDDVSFDRVRRRLLSRWEEQMFAAERRLRRDDLHASDRMVAWSYLMLRAGMQQHAIGRAVVADVLGETWAHALAEPTSARNREAPATAFQKQRKTTARAFRRRNTT